MKTAKFPEFELICTCGPACRDHEILKKLALICNGFRLNIAHMSRNDLKLWLNKLTELRAETNRNFSIIIDLQGAKVRIGSIPSLDLLPQKVKLFYGESSREAELIPVPEKEVFLQTRIKDRLLLNDRKVILKVVEKDLNKFILTAEVEQNGPLSSGKGLNSPDRVFMLSRITEKDKQAIMVSKKIENLFYAISFVADGNEVELFKPVIDNNKLIAKIEQCAAFKNLQNIYQKFDQLWLCRGDLGAEAGLKKLGFLQKKFIEDSVALEKRPVLAGEVLGSMVEMRQPSRAEVVQLYNAINDGFSGIVLSDETAVGENVQAVIDFLNNIKT
ncbi:MAG: pyruvate kinase [Candidatus Rifleibacteriota bacterium]